VRDLKYASSKTRAPDSDFLKGTASKYRHLWKKTFVNVTVASGCASTCVNLAGFTALHPKGFVCGCPAGQVLSEDSVSCQSLAAAESDMKTDLTKVAKDVKSAELDTVLMGTSVLARVDGEASGKTDAASKAAEAKQAVSVVATLGKVYSFISSATNWTIFSKTTSAFVLEAERGTPADFAGKTVAGGAVDLPAAIADVLKDSSGKPLPNVELFLTKWKSYPAIRARGNSDEADKTKPKVKLGAQAVSLNFRSNGKKVAVQKLATPLKIQFAVPKPPLNNTSAANTSAASKFFVRCTYWDEAKAKWSCSDATETDPECVAKPVPNTTDTYECSYTHMTDFGALLGERPEMNDVAFSKIFTKEYLVNNPHGAILSLVLLVCTLLVVVWAWRAYADQQVQMFKHHAEHHSLNRYRDHYREAAEASSCCGLNIFSVKETRGAGFGQEHVELLYRSNYASALYDIASPFTHFSERCGLQCRTGYIWATVCCGLRGDPFVRPQRVLVVFITLLVTLMVSALFFKPDDSRTFRARWSSSALTTKIAISTPASPRHPARKLRWRATT